MNEIKAIGIKPHESEKVSWAFECQNDSSNADDFEHATCARSEIDEDVFIKAVVELQRCRVED